MSGGLQVLSMYPVIGDLVTERLRVKQIQVVVTQFVETCKFFHCTSKERHPRMHVSLKVCNILVITDNARVMYISFMHNKSLFSMYLSIQENPSFIYPKDILNNYVDCLFNFIV